MKRKTGCQTIFQFSDEEGERWEGAQETLGI